VSFGAAALGLIFPGGENEQTKPIRRCSISERIDLSVGKAGGLPVCGCACDEHWPPQQRHSAGWVLTGGK
jgi:hypothetical protein